MLAEVHSIDDAKNLMDMASAAKHYAQKHKLSKEAVGYARVIEIRAEIPFREFLAEMRKNKVGISYDLSSETQVLATLPESDQNDIISGKTSKKAAKKKHRQNGHNLKITWPHCLLSSFLKIKGTHFYLPLLPKPA